MRGQRSGEERRSVVRGWLGAVALAVAAGPALSESNAVAPSVALSSGVAATSGKALSVDGFRSAHFGANEATVRAAIKADFGLSGDAVKVSENPVERTKILAVSVSELIPGGGTAQVAYVLGYSSKGLIQVGVSWSHATDPNITPKMLYDNGDVLKAHFLTQGYARGSIRSGIALEKGLLMFRGSDRQGHATILLLQGSYAPAKPGARKLLRPSSLDLLYSLNPDHPDIFRLPKGSF